MSATRSPAASFHWTPTGFCRPYPLARISRRSRTACPRKSEMSWPYDYIIIGAGSAGCAIANRLAEDLALRILIIEAGPPDSSFMLKKPAGFASLGDKTPYNWRYETTPQKTCHDRSR